MKKIRAYFLIPLVVMTFIVTSCTYFDQFRLDRLSTEVEFSPSIAAPLAYGSFSLYDVLTAIDSTGLVEQTDEGLLFLYYTDTAYSVQAGGIIDFPDRLASALYIKSNISTTEWDALPEGQSLPFTKTEKFDFEIEEGDRIDSVILSTGELNIDVSSTFQHAGKLTISSSDIFTPQGDTLKKTFTISETNGSYTKDTTIVLTDYTLTFQEMNDSAFAVIHYLLELTKSSNPIDDGDECSIEMSFENLDFSKIFGFVAEREVLNSDQSIDVKFYEAVAEILTVDFFNPQLNIIAHNSYGIPLSIELQNVIASSSYNETSTPMTFDSPDINPFKINAPTVNMLGETVSDTAKFTYENTNIENIISEAPDRFDFTVVATTGSTPGSQSFVLDTSKMVLEAEIVLPMWLKTDGYTLTDTMDLEEALGLGDLSFVESAELRLFTTNELPLELEVQVYFLDQNQQVLDSLFDSTLPLLLAPDVDGEGNIIESSIEETMNPVTVTGEEIMKLEDATDLVIKAKAITSNQGAEFVKFFAHYLLSYRLDIAADFIINPSELEIDSD
jgi:hypothetical protein